MPYERVGPEVLGRLNGVLAGSADVDGGLGGQVCSKIVVDELGVVLEKGEVDVGIPLAEGRGHEMLAHGLHLAELEAEIAR